MGFLDSILGTEKNDVETPKASGTPFKVSVNFAPVRLSAMRESSIRMLIKVTNLSNEEQMVSADTLLPRNGLIGFEPACISKHNEKKIGKLGVGETTEVAIPIYSTNQTKEGNYPFRVVVYSHYLDYDKVIGQVEKNGEIRIV